MVMTMLNMFKHSNLFTKFENQLEHFQIPKLIISWQKLQSIYMRHQENSAGRPGGHEFH